LAAGDLRKEFSMNVLMIGLDGATFTLLDPMMQSGVMPYLRSVVERGVRADLMSTRHPLTPPAWTSMITGRSPEAHGIYDFLRPTFLKNGGVFLKINDFRDNRCETVWSIANRAGRRATSLNFFGMSPAPPIDGYIVSGFVPWRHLRQGTYPNSLFDEVRALPNIDYRELGMDIGEEKKCVQGLHQGEHEPWIELQVTRDRAWTELACYLLGKDRTELTAVVLDGPDKLQHLFWRFVDPAFAQSDDPWHKHLGELCVGFYRQLDCNIRRLMEAAGPDTDVLFTSDHGFGPTTEIFYVNEWLARQGYLTWSDAARDDSHNQLTPDRIKDHLGMVDWKSTNAFSPTPSSNAIFVKKDIGSGHGVKDEDYLPFVLNLQRELLEVRDPVSGEPVVVGADLNKLRGTNFVEPCPDITLRLRDGGFVSILKSNEVLAQRPYADGTHRPAGIFIGHGPSFRQNEAIRPLSILDIAPLMLTLLGVPVPSALEGRVPTEALRDTRTVKHSGDTRVPDRTHDEPAQASDDEREALMQQLKILGYLD
jgi:predicted AlkP superfamily phosphohydrolase/phosphomutase